ncbi:hypothetical protein MSAN_00562800 [Mycena sanguinolenta]|uniref:Uncharacterized protein n=1 Tax=Mycena sanguinolenta TaxID=230812 RepID=A0A8H7DFH0_9AGAR|nr:hypothetical protein MSAN_00562800 [Mycena sanguinolenta]
MKKIQLHFPPSFANLSFLSTLPVVCPHLTHVTIHLDGVEYCPETRAAISTLFPALEALECLVLAWNYEGNHDWTLDLGLLPKLMALDLTGPPKPVAWSSTRLVAGSFPRLRDLKIRHVDIMSSIELFRSVDINLVKFHLALFHHTTTPQMTELVHALTNVLAMSSLETLALHPDFPIVPPHVMTADALREFSVFCGLKSVHIAWSFGPDLDDATMNVLTASWTHLTNLELEQIDEEDNTNNTKLTLKSLLSLARNCPHLQHFELTVDAREVPELPDVAPQRILKSMDIASSPIQSTLKVARYLSGIFPNVKRIGPSDHSPEFRKYRKLWEQVLKQLPEFVAVRKELEKKFQRRMGSDGRHLVS